MVSGGKLESCEVWWPWHASLAAAKCPGSLHRSSSLCTREKPVPPGSEAAVTLMGTRWFRVLRTGLAPTQCSAGHRGPSWRGEFKPDLTLRSCVTAERPPRLSGPQILTCKVDSTHMTNKEALRKRGIIAYSILTEALTGTSSREGGIGASMTLRLLG